MINPFSSLPSESDMTPLAQVASNECMPDEATQMPEITGDPAITNQIAQDAWAKSFGFDVLDY